MLEKNPDEVAPLASLTKLMTGMIVLDQAPALEETLIIDSADIDQLKHAPSRIPVGATLEREEMLRLALMSSENRSASALSRNIDGGQPAFIRRMNEKANALGMTRTHFNDPTGLSPQNVSTARDAAKMADAASRYPLIQEFTTLLNYHEEVGRRTLFYRNSDPMVGKSGWDILLSKTGFTNEAGRCIVVEAKMPNAPVIIVLMGAPSPGARTADLISIRTWLEGNETPSPRRECITRAHRRITIKRWPGRATARRGSSPTRSDRRRRRTDRATREKPASGARTTLEASDRGPIIGFELALNAVSLINLIAPRISVFH